MRATPDTPLSRPSPLELLRPSGPTQHESIVIQGAREHNLRDIDVTLPRDRLVVITGPSGSGKSSLAFDTLYAEGQRRYVESLSAYARQFLDQLTKPDVEAIEGLSPALAIEQRSIGSNPRSTVGTATEISDYLRLLYARAGQPVCPQCGRAIATQSAGEMCERIMALPEGTRIQILAPVVRGRKGAYRKELDEFRRKGYVAVRVDGVTFDLSEEIEVSRQARHDVDVVVDRLVVKERIRARLGEAIDASLRMADGFVKIGFLSQKKVSQNRVSQNKASQGTPANDEDEWLLSRSAACSECGVSLPELAPRLFSFNSPAGACPGCDGLGVRREFHPSLVVPDPDEVMRRAIAPWQRKPTVRYYAQLMADLASHFGVDPDTPWRKLPKRATSPFRSVCGPREPAARARPWWPGRGTACWTN